MSIRYSTVRQVGPDEEATLIVKCFACGTERHLWFNGGSGDTWACCGNVWEYFPVMQLRVTAPLVQHAKKS